MHSAYRERCSKSTGHRAGWSTLRTAEAEMSNTVPIAHCECRAKSTRGCTEAGMEAVVPAVPAWLAAQGGRHSRGENFGCATRRSSAQPGPVAHSLTDGATKPHNNPTGSALLFACEKGKAEAILILEMLSLQTTKTF